VSASHTGWRRRRRTVGALAGLALMAGLAAPPPVAQAAGVPGTGPFGLTPAPTPAGQARPYFSLTVAPGRSAQDVAIISNEGTRTERLTVSTSRAVTAANSGSAYEGITGKCGGASCWVVGLPVTVTLAPGARTALGFRIAVPSSTRPGQYLAGLTAESANEPRPVRVGSNGRASAKVIIIDEVIVGVAVTVGRLSQMRTDLSISSVSAGWIGSTPRLFIPVRNTGQTFAQAKGTISCRSGGRPHSYRVIMETVLPGGQAVLPINAPGLTSGPVPCMIRLRGNTDFRATWSGTVNLQPLVATTTNHPASSVYVSLPENTVPPWAVALMVIGALILGSLLAPLVQSRKRMGRYAGLTRNMQSWRRPRRPAGLPRKRTVTALRKHWNGK
jgi:hypothetical protein